jgi:hypothetical protein
MAGNGAMDGNTEYTTTYFEQYLLLAFSEDTAS